MELFIYLLLGLIMVWVEIYRKKYFVYDLLSIFHFFFFLVYVFTPVMLIVYSDALVHHNLRLGAAYLGNPITPYLILLSYLLFLYGYFFRRGREAVSRITINVRFSSEMILLLMPFAYIFLFGLLYVYIMQFGGLREAVLSAEAYRNGDLEPPPFGFVKRAFPINTIMLYYIYYKLFLEKCTQNRKWYMLFFLCSLAFFMLLVVLNNSRGFFILTLAGLYVMTAMYHQRYFVKFLALTMLFGAFMITLGDPLFMAVPDLVNYDYAAFERTFYTVLEAENSRESASLISNFTHPIVSLETSLATAGFDVEFRYFIDFLIAVISLVPDKLVGFTPPQNVMEINTLLTYGVEKKMNLPGLLALFSYSLGIIGVLLGMFVYGFLGGLLSEFFKTAYRSYPSAIVYIYFLSLVYGYFVFRGEPINELSELFIMTVVILTILFASKVYIKRRNAEVKNDTASSIYKYLHRKSVEG